MIRLHVWAIVTDLCLSAEADWPLPAVVRRLLRLHQVAAYSGQSGCSQECAVLFARFGNEKRFFVMAITQLARRSPAGMSGTWGRPVASERKKKAPARGRGWEETCARER
jgi:hypothetical protein